MRRNWFSCTIYAAMPCSLCTSRNWVGLDAHVTALKRSMTVEEVVALGEWTRCEQNHRAVCPDDLHMERVFSTSVGRDSFVCLRVKLALALVLLQVPEPIDMKLMTAATCMGICR